EELDARLNRLQDEVVVEGDAVGRNRRVLLGLLLPHQRRPRTKAAAGIGRPLGGWTSSTTYTPSIVATGMPSPASPATCPRITLTSARCSVIQQPSRSLKARTRRSISRADMVAGFSLPSADVSRGAWLAPC